MSKFQKVVVHNRCGTKVGKSTVKGYKHSCKVCDEDLYGFETNKRPKRVGGRK